MSRTVRPFECSACAVAGRSRLVVAHLRVRFVAVPLALAARRRVDGVVGQRAHCEAASASRASAHPRSDGPGTSACAAPAELGLGVPSAARRGTRPSDFDDRPFATSLLPQTARPPCPTAPSRSPRGSSDTPYSAAKSSRIVRPRARFRPTSASRPPTAATRALSARLTRTAIAAAPPAHVRHHLVAARSGAADADRAVAGGGQLPPAAARPRARPATPRAAAAATKGWPLGRNHGATRVRIVDGHNDARADQEHDGPDHGGGAATRRPVALGKNLRLGLLCLQTPHGRSNCDGRLLARRLDSELLGGGLRARRRRDFCARLQASGVKEASSL